MLITKLTSDRKCFMHMRMFLLSTHMDVVFVYVYACLYVCTFATLLHLILHSLFGKLL